MKILIVDDEPANVALLQEILYENGYARIESVGDSKLVLETCKKLRPDLILLDLMMPPPDGFAILESGATDFLCKPFDHTEVVLRIRNLLESRRAHVLLDNQRAALEDAIRERTAELHATIAKLQKRNAPASQPA